MTHNYIIIESNHSEKTSKPWVASQGLSYVLEADSDQELLQALEENTALDKNISIDIYKANHIGNYKFTPTTTFKLKRIESIATKVDSSLEDSIVSITETVNESIDLSFIEN